MVKRNHASQEGYVAQSIRDSILERRDHYPGLYKKYITAERMGDNKYSDIKIKYHRGKKVSEVYVEVKNLTTNYVPTMFNDRILIGKTAFTSGNYTTDIVRYFVNEMNQNQMSMKFIELWTRYINSIDTSGKTVYGGFKIDGKLLLNFYDIISKNKVLNFPNQNNTGFSDDQSNDHGTRYNRTLFAQKDTSVLADLITAKMKAKNSPYVQIGDGLYIAKGMRDSDYCNFTIGGKLTTFDGKRAVLPELDVVGEIGVHFRKYNENTGGGRMYDPQDLKTYSKLKVSALPKTDFSFIPSKGKLDPITLQPW